MEEAVNSVERKLDELLSLQKKQHELNTVINEIISIVKKWVWILVIIFSVISIYPIALLSFLLKEKETVSDVLISIIKGNVSIIIACIVAIVIIVCVFLFTKISFKSDKDNEIYK